MTSDLSRRFVRASVFTSFFTTIVVGKSARAKAFGIGLLLIAGCSVLPGHWRPGWNEHWRGSRLMEID